ncbi:bifunctional Rossmann-like alpha-beta-alpha sandwich fold/Aminoacyl-tRNA synthetase [Babesia duncani]|uniref:isoleucine--tRNA ligase n=1 Tax=Babesia duncani TaxID=323732 RepID=A0AAD9UP56_9APIC|nr:bifunctional Rossmann-like alpha-beta-alpha sandwich fold/Aminoacyl-tRNA synthetase [Babesia duncani]
MFLNHIHKSPINYGLLIPTKPTNRFGVRKSHHFLNGLKWSCSLLIYRNKMTLDNSFNFTFEPVDETVNFPNEEEKVLQFWKEIDAFKKSMQLSQGRPSFSFYDGPPFATGLPHYGHILAGTIKDVVTRYAYQTGHHVERRFGWDCHGLPIEHEIDKENNIKHLNHVLEMGIDVYNEKCRSIVLKYSSEWRNIIGRTGRWIDFDNDYKTMNVSYMETLWWIFKNLYDKNLVYRGFQVMPYSTSCTTPVSNFEANLNYKSVSDPSVFVAFKCIDEPIEFVAWTTTPWTLPSNLALIVNSQFKYLLLHNSKTNVDYVVAECRLEYFTSETKLCVGKELSIVREIIGSELVGKRYKPLFDYFSKDATFDESQYNASYRILADDMVTSDAGTGIVHAAPYYGEEDMKVCKKHGIVQGPLPDLIDESGNFKQHVERLSGLYFKDADVEIKKMLKEQSRLIHSGTIVHSYPFCWRSDTPLMYRAVSCWFIKVADYRQDILKCSEQSLWVPQYVKDKRFHNWIADARDWCVSRNRFWGTPIPLWVSQDSTQIVCIGSIKELQQYTGTPITDLHRHFVDHIVIPDPRGDGYPPLRRINEIFDCWFESGSMPYAKLHYPFENKDKLFDSFPGHFIAEGLDQTRGWFYTLTVIATHLFNMPAFKNVIVNGLVLASDGKKMSKRLKNFADPIEIINSFGADSVRLYLTASAAVKAEPLKFMSDGVRSVLKDVLLPWFHSYRFLVQEVTRFETVTQCKFIPDAAAPTNSSCVMDRWIYSITQLLIKDVHAEMKQFKMYNVMPKLLNYLEQLTNWYIRINRDRMRGNFGKEESLISLRSLYTALDYFTLLMSMFAPFTSEMIYKNLKRARGGMESIHFEMLPEYVGGIDEKILEDIEWMQQVILMGRTVRERQKVSLKTPLQSLVIIHSETRVLDSLKELESLIKDELNVMDISFSSDVSCITCAAIPNFKTLGSKLGKDMKIVTSVIKAWTPKEIGHFEQTKMVEIAGHVITLEDVIISRHLANLENENLKGDSSRNMAIILDFTTSDELEYMALARELINRIQKIRKVLKLSVHDNIVLHVAPVGTELYEQMKKQQEFLSKNARKPVLVSTRVEAGDAIYKGEIEIGKHKFDICIKT